MKKLLLFVAIIFLLQKSFAQCGTTVQGNPMYFCGPGCNGLFTLTSTGGTPPYFLTVNSVFIGNYSSSYTMSNQCAGNDTCIVYDNAFSCFDTIIVTITEMFPPPITLQVTNATCGVCYDGAIALYGCVNCTYLWSDTSMTHTNLAPGTYYVTVADQNSCINNASATVGVGNTGSCSASFTMYPTGNPHDYWVVNNSTGTMPLQYDWDWGDASAHDTIAFPTHTYAIEGIYNIVLTITDAGGCMNVQILNSYLARMEQMLTVTVVPQLPTSAVELSGEDIFIYPNPARDELVISSPGFGEIREIEIFDVIGNKVRGIHIEASNIKSQAVLDVSTLTPGIYFVTVTGSGCQKAIKKVVKM